MFKLIIVVQIRLKMCYIGRLKNYIMKVEIDNHVKTFRFPSEDLIYFSQSYKISNYTIVYKILYLYIFQFNIIKNI